MKTGNEVKLPGSSQHRAQIQQVVDIVGCEIKRRYSKALIVQLSPSSTTKRPVGELHNSQSWPGPCGVPAIRHSQYPLRPAPGFWALLTSQVGVGRRELGLEPCVLYHP